jgi:hypothetical protein
MNLREQFTQIIAPSVNLDVKLSQKLHEGRQNFNIVGIFAADDLTNVTMDKNSGVITASERHGITQKAWKDTTPNMVLFLRNAKNQMIITERPLKGFKRYADLDDATKEGCFHPDEIGSDYAVDKLTAMRLEDPKKTAKCMALINEVALSTNSKTINEFLNNVEAGIANATPASLSCDVYYENGKNKVRYFQRAKAIEETVVDPAAVVVTQDPNEIF